MKERDLRGMTVVVDNLPLGKDLQRFRVDAVSWCNGLVVMRDADGCNALMVGKHDFAALAGNGCARFGTRFMAWIEEATAWAG